MMNFFVRDIEDAWCFVAPSLFRVPILNGKSYQIIFLGNPHDLSKGFFAGGYINIDVAVLATGYLWVEYSVRFGLTVTNHFWSFSIYRNIGPIFAVGCLLEVHMYISGLKLSLDHFLSSNRKTLFSLYIIILIKVKI